ncbi:lytic transglycosylase domain-containing protein [Azospirillum doebereinerae]|uniref:lytic transglycosylase domain-containing protein n=1 Tax=Azospirillum doebereinerae TaxID=92933 RepID=UPI001EE6147A|nr:lytic transglycosylase domain-containing protein [Azospirillum doebereinerae]MCG5242365.1 lytic transglycosylase domain-containing protein [Azospirillum doebereinerae]
MKVAQPPLAPIPERKPDPPPANPAADGDDASFLDVMARSQPLPRGRLANGQKAPGVPDAKPEPPMQLADGTLVPLPDRKPSAPQAAPQGRMGRATALATADNPTAARVTLASQQVAGLSGHSFTAILAQATQESGLNTAAKNSNSSAAGPFQFLESTWLDLFRRHGAAYGQGELASQIQSKGGVSSVKDPAVRRKILDLRHDVDVSAGMAARYLSEGRERLEKRLGRPASESESRIAYVMGVGGAAKLIRAAESAPQTVAAELLPSAAKANHNLFHDRASGRALGAGETVARLTRRMEIDQREMFAAISKASEPLQRLDGGNQSPLSPFRTVGVSDEQSGDPADNDPANAQG